MALLAPGGGESYKAVSERMRAWYEALSRHTVVTAHGGTARGLMASLGIAKRRAAPLIDIAQGRGLCVRGREADALRLKSGF